MVARASWTMVGHDLVLASAAAPAQISRPSRRTGERPISITRLDGEVDTPQRPVQLVDKARIEAHTVIARDRGAIPRDGRRAPPAGSIR
jgi:hypothetical protein